MRLVQVFGARGCCPGLRDLGCIGVGKFKDVGFGLLSRIYTLNP